MASQVLVGKGEVQCFLQGRFANRHGLIAGATGTGKTISLQCLAEGLSDLGVPVFMADVKGDLSGISQAGTPNQKLNDRAAFVGMTDYAARAYPTIFWDVYGEKGHPVRATISDMGPLLLSRLLDLNDTQSGVLNILFKYADDNGLLLLDIKDLRALFNFAYENTDTFSANYGAVSKQTIGVLQRQLLALETQGAELFFGEPALKLENFIQTTLEGRGVINVLDAQKLYLNPKLYATFLMWLLSELFETLPERGDADLPKLVFFFDEAHLMFNDAPKALLDKIEQVIRLIRSKGVGVYFISQNPLDIPDTVLGQLGNRIQHALRAFTPRDQQAVNAAATTFRAKEGLDVATAITELGVGEALVSTLIDDGVPSPVERAKIRPPRSRMGTISDEERAAVMSRSPYKDTYTQSIDRESAYEMLAAKQNVTATQAPSSMDKFKDLAEDYLQSAGKSAIRAASSQIGRQIGTKLVRGLMGSLLKSLKS